MLLMGFTEYGNKKIEAKIWLFGYRFGENNFYVNGFSLSTEYDLTCNYSKFISSAELLTCSLSLICNGHVGFGNDYNFLGSYDETITLHFRTRNLFVKFVEKFMEMKHHFRDKGYILS